MKELAEQYKAEAQLRYTGGKAGKKTLNSTPNLLVGSI